MSQPPHGSEPEPLPITGILLMIASMFAFATMDGVSKMLVQTYSVPQLFLVRYCVFIFFALWVCRRIGVRAALISQRPRLQIARAIVLLVEGFFFVWSFRYLGLAETHAIAAAAPLLVTVLAAAVLAERVGLHRWLAVAAGFIGALVIIRPGLGGMSWPVLLPLGATITYAVMQIQTRILGKVDEGQVTIFYTAVVGLAIMIVVGPFFWIWPAPEMMVRDLGLMALVGVLSATAHSLLILAYRRAQASVLSPHGYFLLAWAAVIGLVAFREFPDAWTVAGAGIIVASGIYTFRRERRRKPT